jgi:hypothetical protein
VILPFLEPLVSIARGGGGGSDSGSGGGGVFFIGIVGYVPMERLGTYFRKKEKVLMGSLILWPVSVIVLVALSFIVGGYGALIGIGGILGTGSGLYGWFNKLLKLNKKAEKDLALAASTDPNWDEATILATANKIFMDYQADWSTGNAEGIKAYATPGYQYHVSLMLYALGLAGRRNITDEVNVSGCVITNVDDQSGSASDRVTVAFTASARDILVDNTTGANLYQTRETFVEYWTFLRSSGTWLLESIAQSTEDKSLVSAELRAYATGLGYCFSPDWGWLLLPARGQLFEKGKFGVSDINNHIIGVYEGSLVQVYTYSPNVDGSGSSGMPFGGAVGGLSFSSGGGSSPGDYFLIAQAYLQKSYGNILVRKRSSMIASLFNAPKGLMKVETEWTSFNKKYQVFASSAEGAASFELLQPPYMEKLEALPFDCNIEVVDNVVYFYTKQNKISAANYPAMMSILHEAYTYMKH